jgi:hypothetical protein
MDYEVVVIFTVSGRDSHDDAVHHVQVWRDGYYRDLEREESGELGDIVDIEILTVRTEGI